MHDVVLKDVTAQILNVNGAHYLYVIGGSYGPNDDNSSNIEPCYLDGSDYSNTDHVALDGTTFHDYLQLQAGDHDECIHWQDTDQGLVRNSRFLNCAQQDISFHPRAFGIDRLTHFTIENNVFDIACSNQQAPCGHVSGGGLVFGCNPIGAARGLRHPVQQLRLGGDGGDRVRQLPRRMRHGVRRLHVTGNILGGPVYNSDCTKLDQRRRHVRPQPLLPLTQLRQRKPHRISPSAVYTNPSPGTWDYSEKPGAPSIDYISNGIAYPHRHRRRNPPQHNAPDAGAYEHP